MNKSVFMIMPFSNAVANSNYSLSIKPICEKLHLEIVRADEIFTTNPIYDDIVKAIQDASIIIADITGKNPNVFYELGIAHTLKQKRTIVITQDEFHENPFDIAHFRIIGYKNSIESKPAFEEKLRSTLVILLSDFKEMFSGEFEVIIEVLSSAGKAADLLVLDGINQYKGTINKNDSHYLEGHSQNQIMTNTSPSIKNVLKAFQELGYVVYEHDIVELTEKGKAFIKVLNQKGYKCDQFNDQIFTENYIGVFEQFVNDSKKRVE